MNAGRYALVTGASGGIGECFARALAARGHRLILSARSRDKLEALARDLTEKHQIEAIVLPVDLGAAGAAGRLLQEIQTRNLETGILINNAAFGGRGEFWRLPLYRQMEMLRLNIHALVELTYGLAPGMIAQREGAVINVSSTAGFQPLPYTTTYAATKAFVTGFSMALREELRPYGVRVVTLCPGATRTNFFQAGSYGRRSIPGGMQAPEDVVKEALRALDAGGGLVVPRMINKCSVFVQRLFSRSLVARFAADVFRPDELRSKKR